MFITLYTDASFRANEERAILAWRGKCELGVVEEHRQVKCYDSTQAEMLAIRYAIEDCLRRFPSLEGVFVNSDNLGCVRAFWNFGGRSHKCPAPAQKAFDEIHALLAGRWIRTKHVKAHTDGTDIRSHMNRKVDKMTRKKLI